jgi:DNA-directed RNA polymerase specialized sigma24 family protein
VRDEPVVGRGTDTSPAVPESATPGDDDPREAHGAEPHRAAADDSADDSADKAVAEGQPHLDGSGAVAGEPVTGGSQVVQDAPVSTPAQLRVDFGAHLEANYRRLVAQLYAITLDPAEAHSAVQDAYSRAWRSWATVSRSHDSVGWVRRVAVRSTIRSWRRLRRRSRQPVGLLPVTETGAMVAALRELPAAERRCVVLHHMAGARVEEIAAVEGASLGTTAARLARAQKVVSDHLWGVADPDADPDADWDAEVGGHLDVGRFGPDGPSDDYDGPAPDGDDPQPADEEEDQR